MSDKVNATSGFGFTGMITGIVKDFKTKQDERNIWGDSPYKDIAALECDYVGKVGETMIQQMCDLAGVDAKINGLTTKERGGGEGDGTIKGKTVEIKTARQGASTQSFQHELGEKPEKSDLMLFLDISPTHMDMTLFPNYSREFYVESGNENVKTKHFPTKSVTWRKRCGAFKLDTTVAINNINVENNTAFRIDSSMSFEKFKEYVDKVIQTD